MALRKKPQRQKAHPFEFIMRNPMEFEFKTGINPVIRERIPKSPNPQPKRERKRQIA